MVADERVPPEIDIDKPQRGRERQNEERQRAQQRPAPTVPLPQADPQYGQDASEGNVGERVLQIDDPPRIDEGQIEGDKALVDVEPEGPGCSYSSLKESFISYNIMANDNKTRTTPRPSR